MRFLLTLALTITAALLLAAVLARILPGRGRPYYRVRTRGEREAEEVIRERWKES